MNVPLSWRRDPYAEMAAARGEATRPGDECETAPADQAPAPWAGISAPDPTRAPEPMPVPPPPLRPEIPHCHGVHSPTKVYEWCDALADFGTRLRYLEHVLGVDRGAV